MAKWGYTKDDGPATWFQVAPAAKGKNQSPINIQTSQAKYDAALKGHALRINYIPSHAVSVVNNGKSVTLNYDPAGSYLCGGPLEHKYQLTQFHFHWGNTSDHGSEHQVDGRTYASELHLVHYNSDKFASPHDAAQAPGGLCVLAVFLKGGQAHPAFSNIVDLAHKVPYSGDEASIHDGFDPSLLLPRDHTHYWTYSGSLTTPPCYESVTWIVFREHIEVSEEQLAALRKLNNHQQGTPAPQDNLKGKVVENYRPTQALGGRVVHASFQ